MKLKVPQHIRSIPLYVPGKPIEELEREVRIPLLTVDHRTGKPVEWATYVADFRYRDLESGDRKVEEFKPSGGMSYDAQLKIRCCEAMGIPVAIVTG